MGLTKVHFLRRSALTTTIKALETEVKTPVKMLLLTHLANVKVKALLVLTKAENTRRTIKIVRWFSSEAQKRFLF